MDIMTLAIAKKQALNLIPNTDGVIEAIEDFNEYIQEHGEIAEGFRTDINKNAENIKTVQENAKEYTDIEIDNLSENLVYINSEDNENIANPEIVIADSQADWNENNENSIAHIKNRPFYEGNLETYYKLPEMTIDNESDLSMGFIYITGTLSLEEDVVYEVILNGEVYSVKCVKIDSSGYTLGDRNLVEYPFYFLDRGVVYQIRYGVQEAPITIAVRVSTKSIKKIERKFVDGIAGMDVNGKIFSHEDKNYKAKTGAEIFNDYDTNIALGAYSHAEGSTTKAFGYYSHTEGCLTIADGMHAHAEGLAAEAYGNSSHAEGWNTIASGDSQHAQGQYNIEDTENKYAHIVGNGTKEEQRSNAHTLDWNGNAWYQGTIKVGGDSYDSGVEVALKSDIVKPNWEQNDETATDYIQNRPFYVTDEYEWVEILKNPEIGTSFLPTISPCPILVIGEKYKVIFNDTEYICTCTEVDNYCYIGSSAYNISSGKFDLDEDDIPFALSTAANLGLLRTKTNELPTTFIIYKQQEIIKKLDKQYVDYIPGEKTIGKTAIYDGVEYLCDEGAEIFNGYGQNLAIRGYSHAEGYNTIAFGAHSHAEGGTTIAEGIESHAEGGNTIAKGVAAHAEGLKTKAIGNYSHAEGNFSEAIGNYSHAEGDNTIASGNSQHVQGRYNIKDIEEKYAHIVGNGNRTMGVETFSNAHTLDWDGNAWYAGTVEGTAMILKSSTEGSTKRFKIIVDDSGTITATEI